MDDVMFTVKMLAALKEMSIEELAKNCDIAVWHLRQVSVGNVEMTAYDLRQLSQFTGIPADRIQIKPKKKD